METVHLGPIVCRVPSLDLSDAVRREFYEFSHVYQEYLRKHTVTLATDQYPYQVPLGAQFLASNPETSAELWSSENDTSIYRDGQVAAVRTGETTDIHVMDDTSHIAYGTLRSELTHIIREDLLRHSLGAWHAAWIGVHQKQYIIIGPKGFGKSSAVLYSYVGNDAKIHTDEMIFVTSQNVLVPLRRHVSVTIDTYNRYFADSGLSPRRTITNLFNRTPKYLLSLDAPPTPRTTIQDAIPIILCKGVAPMVVDIREARRLLGLSWVNGNLSTPETRSTMLDSISRILIVDTIDTFAKKVSKEML